MPIVPKKKAKPDTDWAQDINNFYLAMNAKTAESEKLHNYRTEDWIVETKHDGMRCIIYIGHWTEPHTAFPKGARAFARTLSVTNNLPVEISQKIPHITGHEYTYLHGTVLDCEIIHKRGFGASREIMGSSVDRALAMQFGDKPMSVQFALDAFSPTEECGKLVRRMIAQRQKDRMPDVDAVTFYSNNGKADCAPFYGPVTAVVFDVLRYCSTDYVVDKTPLRDRLKTLKDLFTGGLGKNSHLKRSVHFPADRWADRYHDMILRNGGEGTMLKNLNGIYVPTEWQEDKGRVRDSRSGDFRKRKKENTFDVVITGYEDAKETSVKVGEKVATVTKFHKMGWIGAVKFGVYDNGNLIEVGQCSGMSDSVRRQLSENKEHFLTKVIEVESNFMSVTTHALHHPRFVRFREDKRAEDCTLQAHVAAGKGVTRK